MRWTHLGWIAAFAAMAACQPNQPSGPPSQDEVQQMNARLVEYFKKTAKLPPNVTIKLTDVAPAEVPELLAANLEASDGGNTQKVPLVLTRNGRYFIQGQLTDLTVDPFKATMAKISLKDQPMRGNPNSSVTIVEYSDFQCPFCGRVYKMVEDQLLKDYGDKVRLVYKNYPLTSIHPWAEAGAMASACARQQSPDAFWKMYDALFQNQSEINAQNVKEKAEGVIRDAGGDVAKFDACFDNKTALDSLTADQQEATALGVRSTPTFFINGRRLEGAVPYESFKAALDQALAGGTKNAEAAPATSAPQG
jgi:protein-disulfide isomerase